ncbi:MAG: hypothetical protein WKF75_02605, partial [Singulisphaera sp.]
MPLAGEGRGVAGVLEPPGQGDLPDGQPEVVRAAEAGGVVVATDVPQADGALQPADSVRIAAGQQRRAGRRAFRPVGIEVRESDAPGRQPVQVGRPDVPAAVTAEVAIAQVVGQNQDDVRSPRRLGGGER